MRILHKKKKIKQTTKSLAAMAGFYETSWIVSTI